MADSKVLNTDESQAPKHLRVMIAHQIRESLVGLAETISLLGHEVIATVTDLATVGALTASEQPDVVLVVAGDDSAQSLGLIEKVVHEAVCPVIALLDAEDSSFIKEAARLGVFAYISKRDTADLQSSIDIVLSRFAEYHKLEGAFARRAVMERAKGILMERHGIKQEAAFDMLCEKARRSGRKAADVAEAILLTYSLLPGPHSVRLESSRLAKIELGSRSAVRIRSDETAIEYE